MNINTVAGLLCELAHAENQRLKSFEVEHRPTIGDMYVGLIWIAFRNLWA